MAERVQEPGPKPAEASSELNSIPAPPAASRAKTYDEKAVAEILQRAAQLERKRSEGRAELTLTELEQIAIDSGIDPAMVRQAIRDRELNADDAPSTRLAGAPLRRTFERVIDREITQAEHEALASDIREVLGPMTTVPPQVSSLGRSLSFSATVGKSIIDVHIAPRDGTTVIRISVNSSGLAGGLFGGLLGGMGGGVGIQVGILTGSFAHQALGLPVPAGVAVGVAGFVGMFTGAFSLARMLFGRNAGRVHGALERLADRLEATVRSGGT